MRAAPLSPAKTEGRSRGERKSVSQKERAVFLIHSRAIANSPVSTTLPVKKRRSGILIKRWRTEKKSEGCGKKADQPYALKEKAVDYFSICRGSSGDGCYAINRHGKKKKTGVIEGEKRVALSSLWVERKGRGNYSARMRQKRGVSRPISCRSWCKKESKRSLPEKQGQ